MNKSIVKITTAIGCSIDKENILIANKKIKIPLLHNDVKFKVYERGDENKNLKVHFFNPVSDIALRGTSPAMEIVLKELSKRISKTMITLTVLIMMELQAGSVEPALQKLYKGKITLRMIKEFKVIGKSCVNSVPFVLDTNYGAIINKEKWLVAISIMSNMEEIIPKDHEFREEYLQIINKILSEGVVDTSNSKKYTIYDGVQKAYTKIQKRLNRLTNVFEGSEQLLLDPMPSISTFTNDDDIYFKRANPFRDLVSDVVVESPTSNSTSEDDVEGVVNMFGQIEYGGRDKVVKETPAPVVNAQAPLPNVPLANTNVPVVTGVAPTASQIQVQPAQVGVSNNGIQLNVPQTPVVNPVAPATDNAQMMKMMQMMLQQMSGQTQQQGGIVLNNTANSNTVASNGIQLGGAAQQGIQLSGLAQQQGMQLSGLAQQNVQPIQMSGSAFGF